MCLLGDAASFAAACCRRRTSAGSNSGRCFGGRQASFRQGELCVQANLGGCGSDGSAKGGLAISLGRGSALSGVVQAALGIVLK